MRVRIQAVLAVACLTMVFANGVANGAEEKKEEISYTEVSLDIEGMT